MEASAYAALFMIVCTWLKPFSKATILRILCFNETRFFASLGGNFTQRLARILRACLGVWISPSTCALFAELHSFSILSSDMEVVWGGDPNIRGVYPKAGVSPEKFGAEPNDMGLDTKPAKAEFSCSMFLGFFREHTGHFTISSVIGCPILNFK